MSKKNRGHKKKPGNYIKPDRLHKINLKTTKKQFAKTLTSRGKLMTWADEAIEKLQKGETVQIRPRGHSMKGLIEDNDLVTVQPLDKAPVVGNIVLVKLRGRVYLHLVKSKLGADLFLIGNNRGGINGRATRTHIYGIATKIEK